MSRGSRGRGRGRGFRGNNNNFRGRGNGAAPPPPPPPTGRQQQNAVRIIEDAIDFPVAGPSSAVNLDQNNSKPFTPRGGRGRGFRGNNKNNNIRRGRGFQRGGYPNPSAVELSSPPPGWGESKSPRGQPGRGRGRGGRGASQKLPSSAPLSKLLYEDRPLLRPITFVPSTMTPTLFRTEQEEEDQLMKPLVVQEEDVDHLDRLFFQKPGMANEEEVGSEDVLEEIDFSEIGAFQEKVEKNATTVVFPNEMNSEVSEMEERFTGIILKDQHSPLKEDTNLVPRPVSSLPNIQLLTESVGLEDPSHESVDAPPSTEILQRSPNLTPQPSIGDDPIPTTTDPLSISSDSDLPILIDMDNDAVTPAAPSGPPPMEQVPVQQDPSPSLPLDETSLLPHSVDDNPTSTLAPPHEEESLFFIDTTPSLSTPLPHSSAITTAIPLGGEAKTTITTPISIPPSQIVELDDDEEIIVYSPPHPNPNRHKKPSSTTAITPFPTIPNASPLPLPRPKFSLAAMTQSPQAIFRERIKTKRVVGRRERYHQGRGRRGMGAEQRPGLGAKRREGSDIDWGSASDEDEGEGGDEGDVFGGGPNGGGDMQVDEDVAGDVDAMKRFVEGMGKGWVTMDDIEDDHRAREEMVDSDVDDDMDAMLNEEENFFIGEDGEEDDSEDEEFEVKLKRLREGTPSHHPDGDDDTWLDEDEFELDSDDDGDDFFVQMQMLVGNATSSSRGSKKKSKPGKKERWALRAQKAEGGAFSSIINGSFEEMADEDEDSEDDMFPVARKRSKKPTHLSASLQAQWANDRLVKAERKRLRDIERIERAADPFVKKKGGKKGKNDMFRSLLTPEPNSPNRMMVEIDISNLVSKIEKWVSDEGGSKNNNMVLPPCPKGTRATIHQIATVYGLKSKSKGKGDGRYTTLVKTARTSGELANRAERKLRKILKENGGGRGGAESSLQSSGKKGNGGGGPPGKRFQDGDVVGKAAPKLTQSNIGFQLLALMGWEEGDRIGLAAHNTRITTLINPEERKDTDHGGAALDVPLVAIVKNTKLGLGANK